MKVSINQPAYIPWLGYFERIDYADIHIVLDHVQFEKNSYINRNKIISNQDFQWLTIPLKKGTHRESTINKIQTLNNWWIEKHLKSLRSWECWIGSSNSIVTGQNVTFGSFRTFFTLKLLEIIFCTIVFN